MMLIPFLALNMECPWSTISKKTTGGVMIKRFMALFLVLTLVFGAVPFNAYAADAQDTPFDKMGDWMSTLGKSGLEKDQILAQRKVGREAKRAQQEAKKAAKQAEKSAGDAKKKLGL
jgi:hypothetical protein